MEKTECHRMKALPLQAEAAFGMSVQWISQQRVPNGVKMHADLVGSSGFQRKLKVRMVLVALQHTVMRDGMFAVWYRTCHFQAVFRIAPDIEANGAGIFFWTADYNSAVAPCNRMLF